MPAPTRQVVPVRPIAQTSVMAVDEEQKPLVITPPGVSQSGDFLSRFTEVLMFGGALIGIWTVCLVLHLAMMPRITITLFYS